MLTDVGSHNIGGDGDGHFVAAEAVRGGVVLVKLFARKNVRRLRNKKVIEKYLVRDEQ